MTESLSSIFPFSNDVLLSTPLDGPNAVKTPAEGAGN
jgi:hypothetical protein